MKTKTKLMTVMMLGASLIISSQSVKGQSWNLPGNANATAASKLGTTNAIPLRLTTSNVVRATITSAGNFGIGITAPTAKLHVSGTTKLNGATTITGNATVSGTLGVGLTSPPATLGISSTSLGGIATTGSMQIGLSNTQNLVLDNNEVFSRFNGGPSSLFLQFWGGDLNACSAGGFSTFGGGGAFNSFSRISAARINNPPSSATDITLGLNNTSATFYPGISLYSDATSVYTILYGKTDVGGLQVVDNTNAYAPVFASAFTVSSDRRLKKDINDINADQYDKYMNYIRNIESATFRYNSETEISREVPHIGVIAQSLPAEVVAPVSSHPGQPGNDRLGVNLADMQGLLLVGVKSLDSKQLTSEAKIDAQQKKIEELETSVKNLETALSQCCTSYSPSRGDVNNQLINDKPSLEQNNPNPFSTETNIQYYLPANSTAVLKVMSLEGQEMLSQSITKTGYGQVRISGNSLAAGTYTYTLLVNGKAVESKIMVLTK